MILLELMDLERQERCDACTSKAAYRFVVSGPVTVHEVPTVPMPGQGRVATAMEHRPSGAQVKLCYRCVEAAERLFMHGGGRYAPAEPSGDDVLLGGLDE